MTWQGTLQGAERSASGETRSRRIRGSAMSRAVAPESSYSDVAALAGEYQQIGGRKQQEDRTVCIADLNALAKRRHPEFNTDVRRSFYAVFDGFGGPQVVPPRCGPPSAGATFPGHDTTYAVLWCMAVL